MKKFELAAGSAIENGVMFATKENFAIARYSQKDSKKTDQDEDLGDELEIITGKMEPPFGGKILNSIPFVAGFVYLIGNLVGGEKKEPWKTINKNDNTIKISRAGTFVVGAVVLIILSGFSYLIGSGINSLFGVTEGTFLYGIFLNLFLAGICVLFPIVMAYFIQGDILNFHGAEHKVSNAERKRVELTKENVNGCSRFHVHCSTNLVVNSGITTIIINALLYSWTGSFCLAVLIGLIVSILISIELLRISSWFGNSPFGYLLSPVGLWAQKITVKQPEDRHLEAAIAAMNALKELEEESSE